MPAFSKKLNAEQTLATRQLISEIISDAPIREQLMSQETTSAAAPQKSYCRWFLSICLFIAIALTLWQVSPELIDEQKYKKSDDYDGEYYADKEHPFLNASDFDAHEQLLLHLNTGGRSRIDTLKALWDRAPDNPVYFAQYASAYLMRHESLPPDFLANARKVDPNNAWFTYLAAAEAAKQSMRRVRLPHSGSRFFHSTYHEETILIISDRNKADIAQRLLEEASQQQQQCNDYDTAWMREVIPHLPQENYHQHIASYGSLLSNSSIFLRHLFEFAGLQAAVLASAENSSKLHHLSSLTEDCLTKLIRREQGAFVAGVTNYILAANYHNTFSSAFLILGENQLAEKHRVIHEKIKAVRASGKKQKISVEEKSIDEVGDELTGVIGPSRNSFLQTPILIRDSEIAPRRLAEHDAFNVKCAIAAFLYLLAIISVVWASQYWQPRPIREVAKNLKTFLTKKDWGWIVGIGVLLPYLTTFIITRGTPLGGRQTTLNTEIATVHYIGLMALFATLPILIIRWRIRKSLSVRYSKFLGPWIGWISAVAILTAIILAESVNLPDILEKISNSDSFLFLPVPSSSLPAPNTIHHLLRIPNNPSC